MAVNLLQAGPPIGILMWSISGPLTLRGEMAKFQRQRTQKAPCSCIVYIYIYIYAYMPYIYIYIYICMHAYLNALKDSSYQHWGLCKCHRAIWRIWVHLLA